MNGARSEAEVIRRSRVAQKKPWASAQGVSFTVVPYYGPISLSDASESTSFYPLTQEGTLILGPITLIRERGRPKTEQVFFTVSDATGPFLLRLTNGTSDGKHRVSSALVKLNGREVFRPSEFNQKVAGLNRQVTLLSGENLIEVRLRSAPGAFITLEIFRLDQHACPVVGLHSFIRSEGKPVEETLVFDLNPQFGGAFTLNLTSGNADGSNRVDSAIITLNGVLVFDPNDFNEQTSYLSRVVSLQSTNTLNVKLTGAPGDLLTIEITGYDNTPPSVTITSPSNGAIFNTSPISVSGMADDPSASVTVNGVATPVASDGSFTLKGVALQEGENIIKVIATDACGNQGEDEILVYLKTVPEGPQLTLCIKPPIVPTFAMTSEDDCLQEALIWGDYGVLLGYTDETAVSITLNGILLPDGIEITEQGDILWGLREGTFFYADVKIPEIDGVYPFTAVATDANGSKTSTTVTFLRDTTPPKLTLSSPSEWLVTNNPTITVTGTVDDPLATVIVELNWQCILVPVVNGIFSTQVNLPREGWNYLNVNATDPYGNVSIIFCYLILDTTPPQINITSPIEGMAVNTSTMQISGTVIDQNIETIKVAVNNGQPQPLTLTGSNFSGTVTLNPGPNTLTFSARDKAGNTGNATRSVILDLELPAVAITTPQPGAVISGVVTVTAEASDTISGITSVTLYVDGQMQTTLSQPPFNFTLNTSIFASGMHTIKVRAKDRAGNESEASVSVTIDNTAPIVAITVPLSGAVVSGLITVSVQASDANSGITSVSLYVDGQHQASLTQPPFNFSLNTLLFASGSHTLTARGIDKTGNQADASVLIVFDHMPPAVSITSPASGAVVSGIITVTVEANDSISGIASVALYVDNQPPSILSQPPFNFTVDTSGFVPGSYTVTVRAVDQVGNQSEASITIWVSALRIEIISPANGATVNKTAVLIQGKIYNQTGEIGVVVNGVLSQMQGGDFATIVPLQLGMNILTATATTVDGIQVQTSVTINTDTQQEMIRLTVYPSSGVLRPPTNTLDVTFEAEAYLANPVSSYSWDFNGDGIPEITGTETTVIAQYQYPGLYYPRVTVTDNQGNTYIETTIVHVISREEMDALLRAKWEGMRGALLSGNIEAALAYFAAVSREKYLQVITDLGSTRINSIFSRISEFKLDTLYGQVAECGAIRLEAGGRYSYPVTFVKDENGIWKIFGF